VDLSVIASFIIKGIDKVARIIISLAEILTGAKIVLPEYHAPRCKTAPVYSSEKDILDESACIQASTFSIPPEQLIEKCKELLKTNNGCERPSLLSSDFLFIFPVVGPLNKDEFIQIYSSFGVGKALSGSPNFYNFHIDPLEPNRVWFSSRAQYQHTGDLNIGYIIKATGKSVESPPQVLSMSFNDAGECYKFTGGYSVDKSVGNTQGLGGLFGVLHSLGSTLPFSEGQPMKYSLGWEAYAKHFPTIPKLWK